MKKYLLLALLSGTLLNPALAQHEPDPRFRIEGTGIHYSMLDFKNYRPFFGSNAVEALNGSMASLTAISGRYGRKYNTQFHTGVGYWSADSDTIHARSFATYHAFTIGRHLVNNNWLIINPQIGIQGYGAFFRTASLTQPLSLSQFTASPPLRMLMIQTFAVGDLEIGFKLPRNEDGYGWIISLKAGYIVPLHRRPWVVSGLHRISNTQPILTQNLHFQVSLIRTKPLIGNAFNRLKETLEKLPDTDDRSIL